MALMTDALDEADDEMTSIRQPNATIVDHFNHKSNSVSSGGGERVIIRSLGAFG